MTGRSGRVLALLVLALAPCASGCALYYRVGMALYYDEVELPPEQMREDVPYTDLDHPKLRLDLFLPEARAGVASWPTVVFVHGGGWDEGDKDLVKGGADIYGNIGRFFASRGVGAVSVNYRLIPEVSWREQPFDVARAVGWVRQNIAEHGGDPDALFLMGHSAGAQLAVRTALDPAPLEAAGVPRTALLGVIAVSGPGYDMLDPSGFEIPGNPEYFAARFDAAGDNPDWHAEASPIRFVGPEAPPFLLVYGGDEVPQLKRQSELLQAALDTAGVQNELVIVPGETHAKIVLSLSRDDKVAGPAMLEFVAQRSAEGLGRAVPGG